MLKTSALVGLLVLPALTLAETVFVNGQPCVAMGNQVHCPAGVDTGTDAAALAAQAQRAETRRLQQQSDRLSDCLRKSDWPGAPSRSECERMYGQ